MKYGLELTNTIRRLNERVSTLEALDRVDASFTAAYSAYTVTWTAVTTNPAIGNGTLAGRSVTFGNVCHVNIYLKFGSTTDFGSGSYSFSLPTQVANNTVGYVGSFYLLDASQAIHRGGSVLIRPNATVINEFTGFYSYYYGYIRSDRPITLQVDDELLISALYEI
jgi:hypothetical protein